MSDDAIRKAHFESQKPEDQLGDRPIEAEFADTMAAMARAIDGVFNGEAKGPARKVGFVLLVFPFGDKEGRCNIVSNGADRKVVVTLMKEMIARLEGQPEMSGRA